MLYEERDVDRAMELIRDLETLDRNPNQALFASLSKARETAAFIYNLNLFNDIMQRAGIELAAGRYWEAVDIYREGFVLHREDFDRADYGVELKAEVQASVDRMNAAIDRFGTIREPYGEIISRAEKTLAGTDAGSAEQAYREYRDLLLSVQAAAEAVHGAAGTIERRNEELRRSNSDGKEDFFMSYLYKIANGRQSSGTPEGMLHAIRAVVGVASSDLGGQLLRSAATVQAGGTEALDAGRWVEAETAFRDAQRLFITALDTFGLISSGFHPDRAFSLPGRELTTALELVPSLLTARAGAKASRNSADLTAAERLLDELRTLPAPRDRIADARTRLQALKEISGAVVDDQRRFEQALNEAANGYETAQALGTAAATTERSARIDRLLTERDGDAGVAAADLDTAALNERNTGLGDRISEARQLQEGIPETAGGGSAPAIPARYPDRTIRIAESSVPLLEILLRDARTLLDRLLADRDYVLARNDYQERISAVRSLIAGIDALLADARRLIEESRQQVLQAASAKQEGDLRYREAEAALNRSAYQDARDRLGQARDSYLRSLSLQEDPAFRQTSDRQLIALSERIQAAENRIIVVEVRNLINEGRQFYLQEAYERAETVLIRAQNRWKTTNPEDNPEVSYWLGFVQAALFVESNREIGETNPLYTEMIQLLNLARDDYEQGKQLFDRGNRTAALQLFESAEQKVLKVKIPFPYNKEASVLSLRIMNYRDRENFAQIFGQRVQDARAKIARNPQEAYIELRDLQEINARFPGLSEAIIQAEFALGIRKPTITRAQIDEANRLYLQALQIVQGNVRSQFPIALEQLNRAIEVNPENERAIQLKDRILVDAGGQSTVVLSAAAEQLYRQAEEKYIQGSYFEALAIVERLMQDSTNRRYGPLRELLTRINTRLNRSGSS